MRTSDIFYVWDGVPLNSGFGTLHIILMYSLLKVLHSKHTQLQTYLKYGYRSIYRYTFSKNVCMPSGAGFVETVTKAAVSTLWEGTGDSFLILLLILFLSTTNWDQLHAWITKTCFCFDCYELSYLIWQICKWKSVHYVSACQTSHHLSSPFTSSLAQFYLCCFILCPQPLFYILIRSSFLRHSNPFLHCLHDINALFFHWMFLPPLLSLHRTAALKIYRLTVCYKHRYTIVRPCYILCWCINA